MERALVKVLVVGVAVCLLMAAFSCTRTVYVTPIQTTEPTQVTTLTTTPTPPPAQVPATNPNASAVRSYQLWHDCYEGKCYCELSLEVGEYLFALAQCTNAKQYLMDVWGAGSGMASTTTAIFGEEFNVKFRLGTSEHPDYSHWDDASWGVRRIDGSVYAKTADAAWVELELARRCE